MHRVFSDYMAKLHPDAAKAHICLFSYGLMKSFKLWLLESSQNQAIGVLLIYATLRLYTGPPCLGDCMQKTHLHKSAMCRRIEIPMRTHTYSSNLLKVKYDSVG